MFAFARDQMYAVAPLFRQDPVCASSHIYDLCVLLFVSMIQCVFVYKCVCICSYAYNKLTSSLVYTNQGRICVYVCLYRVSQKNGDLEFLTFSSFVRARLYDHFQKKSTLKSKLGVFSFHTNVYLF